MQTLLYKKIKTENIYTFAELKNEYEVENSCEIEVDEDSMFQIIREHIMNGEIELIFNNDKVLKWCNDYAYYVDADRGMTQKEIDNSIREIYLAITNKNDEQLIQSTMDNIEDEMLMERLQKLLGR